MKERVAILADSTKKRALELAQSEQVLITRFNEAGFKDEADYQTACLPEEEREVLSRQEEALRLEQAELNVRWQDKSAALKAEREKKITKQPREKLWQELITSESTLKQTQQEIGAINQRLAENEKLRIKQQEYGKRLETQKKECSRWDSLHELIGSADGKKYRNFAQGITFEIMTGYANRQLVKMTDRYLLIRHNTQPLELNVIDNYQAGEIRSTKNLSGVICLLPRKTRS